MSDLIAGSVATVFASPTWGRRTALITAGGIGTLFILASGPGSVLVEGRRPADRRNAPPADRCPRLPALPQRPGAAGVPPGAAPPRDRRPPDHGRAGLDHHGAARRRDSDGARDYTTRQAQAARDAGNETLARSAAALAGAIAAEGESGSSPDTAGGVAALRAKTEGRYSREVPRVGRKL